MAVYQGTEFSIVFPFVDENDVAVNITGWTVEAQFRVNLDDEDPLFTLTTGDGFTIADGATGELEMTLSEARTALMPEGRVLFDIIRTAPGNRRRLCGGSAIVKKPVTRP